ncbi:hypothetical protein [Pseudomonas sp. SDO55104_S430]
MEIRRQGANRNSGWVAIKGKKPAAVSVQADPEFGPVVSLSLRKTKDPDRNGEYDHEVRLSLPDVVAVIDALSGNGLSKFNVEISEQLSQSVRSLNRLMAAASGIEVGSSSNKE